MKQIFTTSKRTFSLLLFTLIGAGLITSCSKKDDYDFNATATSKVRLINTSTDAGPAILYVADVARVQNGVNFGTASAYNLTYVGQADVTARAANGTVLATANSPFDANATYTFLLAGTNGSYSLLALPDATTAPASGKAKVRFVQASSGLASANLLGNGTSLFTAQSFKSVGNYTDVTAGTYVFTVTNGSSNTALAVSTSISLQAGKTYTLFAYGVSGAEANPLAVSVLANN